MKFKKLLISASAVAAGTGLLATVLTSCAKQNIEDDLKIKLDENGFYVDPSEDQSFINDRDFRSAIKNALKTSSTWETFKESLAKEIVLKWYEDRKKTDEHPNRNEGFTNFLNRQNYQINDDYNKQIDSLKSKYGANHPFYVQNELLAKNGGTEEAYKHLKLLDKVKDDFITNVFTTNYFGIANESRTGLFPHIFTNVMSSSLRPEELNNPALWSKIGFYAKANSSFVIDDTSDTDALANHPDGDYAVIQNYVFNRWFKTEKPFFSAASLFKYANPVASGENLKTIYNGTKITASLDKPSEAFPFFGKAKKSNGFEGTAGFYHWFKALADGKFESEKYPDDKGAYISNKTISIPTEYTEDSQTLLLCYGSRMLGGADSGTLYVPYAVAAASLYNQMVSKTNTYHPNNIVDQNFVHLCAGDVEPAIDEESPRLLKLFFYPNTASGEGKGNIPAGVKSYMDLKQMYDYTDESGANFHSSLFKENKNFTFFYGNTDPNVEDHEGVRFVTNNVQADLGPQDQTKGGKQPWVLELNEAGVHAQTIDGYQYVYNTADPLAKLKEVVMYRLMQQQCGWSKTTSTSASVFGANGDLKSYFTKHFADIILEMAFSYDSTTKKGTEENIFRNIETYKNADYKPTKDDEQFFVKFCTDERLGVLFHVEKYIETIKTIDDARKNYNSVVAANKSIYNYRTKQITNSKFDPSSNTKYDNGVLASLGQDFENSTPDNFGTTHHYKNVIGVIIQDLPACTRKNISDKIAALNNDDFIKDVDLVKINDENDGFSPQIDNAIRAGSNRFWFRSSLADHVLCQYMDASSLANHIKISTYNKYQNDSFDKSPYKMVDIISDQMVTSGYLGITSAYFAKKLISGDNTYASYVSAQDATDNQYFYHISEAYHKKYMADAVMNNGVNCDEKLAEALYYTTIAWLAKDNFKHFYETLDQKIKDGERSYVGYITKYNRRDPFIANPRAESVTSDSSFPYKWSANVGNIYDDFNYQGGQAKAVDSRVKKLNYDAHWNVVYKEFNNAGTPMLLSGFLGLQTPSNNQLDSSSGLHDAAFGNNFALSTLNAKTVDTEQALAYEQGTLFPWAGVGKEETDRTKDTYYFKDVTFGDKTIKYTDFDTIKPARKLAQTIALTSAPEDIRSLANKIGTALVNGNNAFMKVAKGEIGKDDPKTAADAMKHYLLSDLLKNDAQQYTHALTRISNVEFRKGRDGDYCFENATSDEGFKFMFTQLNKADVKEERLHPTFTNSTWTMVNGSPLTLQEFWYIFASIASESSYQDEAMKDAIRVVYKDNKLVVHDAQLYNKFDATWIKDWKKKTMGA